MDYTTLGDILVVKDIIVCCPILRDISTLKIKSFNCNFSNNRKRLKMHSCTRMKEAKRLLLWLWVHVAALCNKIHLLLRCVAGFPFHFHFHTFAVFLAVFWLLSVLIMRRLNCRSYDCEIISCEAAGGSTCTAALRNPFDTYPDERLLIELQLKYLHPNEVHAAFCSIWSLWTPFTFFN